MEPALLTTKLQPPRRRPDGVGRPRLSRRLQVAGGGDVVLVSAPAGYGKTTAVVDGLAGAGRVAWLALDPQDDQDPATFFRYLIAALQTADPSLGRAAAAGLGAPRPPSPAQLLTSLINDLSRAAATVTLVIDDCQHLAAAPPIDGLRFLVTHQPATLRLVLISRADPPLPLAALRAAGRLLELRAADLRFTVEEAAHFLQATGLPPVAPADVAALTQRTEGWAAGLQLSALALRSQTPAQLLADLGGSQRFILDYLVTEVLAHLPADLVGFLHQTSVVDRLSAPLCQALTGRSDADALLQRLEQENLFLQPLDGQRRWYRYHRLFADLLRVRAQAADPDAWRRTHARAARWWGEAGEPAAAFNHWLAAEAPTEAAALLERAALDLLTGGQTGLLLSWLARLPADMVAATPRLAVHQAWGLLLTGRYGKAGRFLETAAADPALAGHVAAIHAYGASLDGDMGRAAEQAARALQLLPPADAAIRSVVAFVLGGIQYAAGKLDAAREALQEAVAGGTAGGNPHVAVPARCTLAGLALLQGRPAAAEAQLQAALAQATAADGTRLPFAAQPLGSLADLALRRLRLDEAQALLDEAHPLSTQWQQGESLVGDRLTAADLARRRGDLARAAADLAAARELATRTAVNPQLHGALSAMAAALALDEGRPAAALSILHQSGAAAAPASFARLAEQRQLVVAWQATGEHQAAARLLADHLRLAEAQGRHGDRPGLFVLQAAGRLRRGRPKQALAALAAALGLWEPAGDAAAFLDGGPGVLALLRELPAGAKRDALLAVLAGAAPAQADHDPLSRREQEVLALLAQGLSNRAIAGRLVVAPGTVKAHTAAIYRKLDVHNRLGAIARARELGLI